MSLKEIIESFTKKEIQSFLKKLKDNEYRSSWKKSKLAREAPFEINLPRLWV